MKLKWEAIYPKFSLPPVKWVKDKHNNRTKTNVRGSDTTTFISKGRIKKNPSSYKCIFINEEEGYKIQRVFLLLGIYVSLEISEEISLEVEFSDIKKFLGRVKNNKEKKQKEDPKML